MEYEDIPSKTRANVGSARIPLAVPKSAPSAQEIPEENKSSQKEVPEKAIKIVKAKESK